MLHNFGQFAYPFAGLITLLALLVYFATILIVRSARIKFEIAPPTTDGPEEFRRAIRTQANTVEQIVLFLPALWLCALNMGDGLAATIGVFWPLSRTVYNQAYVKGAKLRMQSFIASLATSLILLLVAMIGVVASLLG